MAGTLQLDIVSAEAHLLSCTAAWLSVTGASGELGICPGHRQLLTALKPGQIKVHLPEGGEEVYYISGGVLEVQPEVVTVLADTAIRAADLNEAAALATKEEAEKKLSQQKAGLEYSTALVELAEAVAQLRAIEALRKRKR